MAELIVLASFLRIAENGVCLGSLLEFFLGFFVTGIGVRMIFFREDPVCLFQRGLVGIFVDSENLIIISLLFRHVTPPNLWTQHQGTRLCPLVSLFSVFFLSAENLLPQAIRYFIPL